MRACSLVTLPPSGSLLGALLQRRRSYPVEHRTQGLGGRLRDADWNLCKRPVKIVVVKTAAALDWLVRGRR